MNAYEVFQHPERDGVAVKRGFSWPGFFFTWIWALSRKMWPTALVLVLSGWALGAVTWGMAHNSRLFTTLVALVYGLVVGLRGNSWRSAALEKAGYLRVGAINAHNPQDAVAKVKAAGGMVPAELRAGAPTGGMALVPKSWQGMFAIIALTWKAAFRYRLFWVIVSLLLAAVIGLPLLIKHDGTAQGFAQILITYTLGAVTGLLGLCTLWLACGTLARDVEECQIQMVVVKPIARWQVWLGKWLGLVSLNAALLALAGVSIYGLLEWRAKQLAPDQLTKLENEVLVARTSLHEEDLEPKIQAKVDEMLADRLAKSRADTADTNAVRQQILEQVRAQVQVIPPDKIRLPLWVVHLGKAKNKLHGQPLYLRVKFIAAQGASSDTYNAQWWVGDPYNQGRTPWESPMYSLSADTFHEIQIDPDLYDDKGDLYVTFHNPNPVALLFPLNDGFEVLYREGGFGFNFVRGLAIILCWMALLAALGMAAASFLSFPVAAFVSLAALTIVFSSGTISGAVSEGTIMGFGGEGGVPGQTAVDTVMLPVFKGILWIIKQVQQFSPVDSLSTGRSISWPELGRAVGEIVLLLGGILALFGIFAFHRRELATAQSTHN